MTPAAPGTHPADSDPTHGPAHRLAVFHACKRGVIHLPAGRIAAADRILFKKDAGSAETGGALTIIS